MYAKYVAIVAVAVQIALNSCSLSTANTVPTLAKSAELTGSAGYIAVGPTCFAVDGSGTALATDWPALPIETDFVARAQKQG